MIQKFTSTNEHELMKNIQFVLNSCGYHTFRANVGKIKIGPGRWFDTGLPKGHPDLYGYTPKGRCFYLEVKFGKGKPSSEQIKFIQTAQANNCLAGVVYSIEEALQVVGLGKGSNDRQEQTTDTN